MAKIKQPEPPAASRLETKCSTFKTHRGKPEGPIPIREVLDQIKNPAAKVRGIVARVRGFIASGDKEQATKEKAKLPAFTPSGSFAPDRKKDCLAAHTGCLIFDFDNLCDDGATRISEFVLDRLPWAFMFESPSGNGFKVGLFVEPVPKDAEEHESAWLKVAGLFRAAGFDPDKSGKDVSRLCYLSHDQGAAIDLECGVLSLEKLSGPSGTRTVANGGNREKVFALAEVGRRQIEVVPAGPEHWRAEIAVDNRAALIEQYGDPYRVSRVDNGVPVSFKVNERFMAARIAAEAGIVYDPASGFWRYSGENGLWAELSDDKLCEGLGALIDSELRLGGHARLVQTVTHKMLREMVGHVRSFAEQRDFFAKRPDVIVCRNTALSVTAEGVEPEPFSPDHRARIGVPVEYQPSETCPMTEKQLVGLNFSQDDAEVFWKYAGLVVLGRNIVQRVLLIHGNKAGTGKSALVNLLGLLAGESVAELRPHLLHDRFEIDRYVGSRLLVAPDVSSNFLNSRPAQAIKSLCGGDILQPEGKLQRGQGSKTVRGEWPIVVSTNLDLFVYADTDQDAWKRRLVWLETQGQAPAKKIPDFERTLWMQEATGIFARALQGLVALKKDIATAGGLVLSDRQKRHVDILLGQSNSCAVFIDEALEFGRGGDVTKAELHDAYFEFCNAREWKPVRDYAGDLKNLLADRHAMESSSVEREGKAHKGYRGVKLK